MENQTAGENGVENALRTGTVEESVMAIKMKSRPYTASINRSSGLNKGHIS